MTPDEIKKQRLQQLQASVIKMARYTPADSVEAENRAGWLSYGKKNLYPDYIIKQYLSSPVHGTLCAGIAAMIAGKGLQGAPVPEKAFKSLCLDLKLHGGFYVEVRPKLDDTAIALIDHLPFESMRLGLPDKRGRITSAWFSRDWSNTRKPGNEPIQYFKAPEKPFSMWTSEEKNRPTVAWGFMSAPGSMYYPKPDYEPGLNYIELSQQVSEFHINNIMNGLFPSVILTMIDTEADPVKREQTKANFESVQGAEKAGKAIFLWTDSKENVPTITPFPVNDADKQYQFLAEEMMKQILFAHRVTSPLLFGVRDTGGGFGSNKDEMAMAWRIFQHQVLMPFQRIIIDTIEGLGYSALTIEQNDPGFEATPEVVPTKMAKGQGRDFSDRDEQKWIAFLESRGEKVDLDEYEVLDESFVDSLDNPDVMLQHFAAQEKSKWGDSGLFKLRYRYSTNLSDNSRTFCKRMVALSTDGILYRKEDIDIMSENGINGQFAPEGQTTYDIFKWKGGAFCHHKWVRVIFARKRGADGKILPASKTGAMENDKRVANNPYVPKKGDEGVAPINTPSRGSLKYG